MMKETIDCGVCVNVCVWCEEEMAVSCCIVGTHLSHHVGAHVEVDDVEADAAEDEHEGVVGARAAAARVERVALVPAGRYTHTYTDTQIEGKRVCVCKTECLYVYVRV